MYADYFATDTIRNKSRYKNYAQLSCVIHGTTKWRSSVILFTNLNNYSQFIRQELRAEQLCTHSVQSSSR